jgi:hypothetical protein
MASKSRASKLTKTINQHRNTVAGRRGMAPTSFALPATKTYRIDDAAHARNALARVAQHGTPAQQPQVRKAVARKYPTIKVSGTKRAKRAR